MLSVIIPTHNRLLELKKCIESIFQAENSDKIELIIVNDGSKDRTDAYIKGLHQKHNQIKYLEQSNKGPAVARNNGVKHTRGDIIAFTDDDCTVSKEWLTNIIKAHKTHKNTLVIGGYTESASKKDSGFITQFLTNQAIKNEKGRILYFPTNNVSFKKKLFDKFKFNEDFPYAGGEDLEFGWRLYKNNVKSLLDKNIQVTHHINPSIESFNKRNELYGKGNLLVKKLHPEHPTLSNIHLDAFKLSTIKSYLETPLFGFAMLKRLNDKEKLSFTDKIRFFHYLCLHKRYYTKGIVKEFNDTKIEKPKFLIIDSTHKCNLRCKMCDIVLDNKKDLSIEEVKSLIKQGTKWSVKNIVMSGGENFIRKDIFEILEYAKKQNIELGVLTNGIISKVFFEKLKPYLINNNLSLIISLDGKKETHETLRGKGTYKKTIKTFERLRILKKEYPQINYNSISIILNNNLEELEWLVKILKNFNVNSIQFQPLLANNLTMHERKENSMWIPNERLELLDKNINILKKLKQKNPKLISNSEEELELVKKYFRKQLTKKYVGCYAASKTMLVSNDGNITACKTAYGNINTPIENVWRSKKAEKARKLVAACDEPCLLPCFVEVK
ncbi:glycosyltransferase [archaeon]|nr:glycosyltransferase [archaeon]MBL7057362.1 glycosyltransferase [Candidatus Woesearchaeota archaeon]